MLWVWQEHNCQYLSHWRQILASTRATVRIEAMARAFQPILDDFLCNHHGTLHTYIKIIQLHHSSIRCQTTKLPCAKHYGIG